MREKIVKMLTTRDRYVTPTFDARGFSHIELVTPTLDAASAVLVQASRYPHEWNYPFYIGSCYDRKYADNGVILQWAMDDADGTTITDSVCGVVLTEQGDPAYAQSAGVAGLGNGVTYDGTADQHDILVSALPAGLTMPTTGDFSVEIVFKGTTGHNTDVLFTYLAGAFDGGGNGFSFQLDGNEYLDFCIDDGTQQVIDGTTDVATGNIVYALASLDLRVLTVTVTVWCILTVLPMLRRA